MISETLAGTNAGMSEVSLSDTSSSDLHPHCGATAESSGESLTEAHRVPPSNGGAEQSARRGWWNRRAAETPQNGTPLVQVGEKSERAEPARPHLASSEGTTDLAAILAGGE